MVLVEVYVPGLRKSFDFNLSTNVIIDELIDEICLVICQREQKDVIERKHDMVLAIEDAEIIMNNRMMLSDYQVKEGMRLILA